MFKSCPLPQSSPKNEKIKVSIRLRPFTEEEKQIDMSSPIQGFDEVSNTVSIKRHFELKSFTYNKLFSPSSGQKEVFDSSAKDVITSFLAGYNGTIFAYGQTGTGKTYTMIGEEDKKGIIPVSFDYIFETINSWKQSDSKNKETYNYNLYVSFIQIYLESIQDWLNTSSTPKEVRIREDQDNCVFLDGVEWWKVENAEECQNIFSFGDKSRVTQSTQMNSHSSRSHAIFIFRWEKTKKSTCNSTMDSPVWTNHNNSNSSKQMIKSMWYWVDLAGSERLKKTKSENIRLEEAKKINYSLFVLGNCIQSLTDSKCTHISYRDSKLTRLLQGSLGGNSKTSWIVTISPSNYNVDETISSLNFAARAMKVQNKPRIIQSVDYMALAHKLQNELDIINDQYSRLTVEFDNVKAENLRIKNGEEYVELQRKSILNSLCISKRATLTPKNSRGEDKSKDNNNNNDCNNKTSIHTDEETKQIIDYETELKRWEDYYTNLIKMKNIQNQSTLNEIDKILYDKEIENERLLTQNKELTEKVKNWNYNLSDILSQNNNLIKTITDWNTKWENAEKISTQEPKEKEISMLENKISCWEEENYGLQSINKEVVKGYISDVTQELNTMITKRNDVNKNKNKSVVSISKNEIKIRINQEWIENVNKQWVGNIDDKYQQETQMKVNNLFKENEMLKSMNYQLSKEKDEFVRVWDEYETKIELKNNLLSKWNELYDPKNNAMKSSAEEKTKLLCDNWVIECNNMILTKKNEIIEMSNTVNDNETASSTYSMNSAITNNKTLLKYEICEDAKYNIPQTHPSHEEENSSEIECAANAILNDIISKTANFTQIVNEWELKPDWQINVSDYYYTSINDLGKINPKGVNNLMSLMNNLVDKYFEMLNNNRMLSKDWQDNKAVIQEISSQEILVWTGIKTLLSQNDINGWNVVQNKIFKIFSSSRAIDIVSAMNSVYNDLINYYLNEHKSQKNKIKELTDRTEYLNEEYNKQKLITEELNQRQNENNHKSDNRIIGQQDGEGEWEVWKNKLKEYENQSSSMELSTKLNIIFMYLLMIIILYVAYYTNF